MAKVIWAPSALDDIDAIASYIARDSVYHASLFIDRLFETADLLKEEPEIGRIIPEIGSPDCREIIYGSYRIMYRIQKHSIWINAVIHGARDWKPPTH
ncbi:MAG: type II toxin-antitoxin system RelE/ParE family toxin [Chitinivibrionales bacterium]|nr:type II toxin-antitoxin system RelE/ParE family toxin [Chitinivibrionales bacterium]MBD3396514.1 type II toxin-antitoxin system RelE/ParE family toxin [Chitinivibrionales bacterium]